MSITTRSQLAAYVKNRGRIITEHRAGAQVYGARITTIFLSHSHVDQDLVVFAQLLFMKERAETYIDHKDPDMPQVTSPQTARQLKAKIRDNHKFVMLATQRSLSSAWVPWELGYADGAKSWHGLAVLLVQEYSGEWEGSEYIGLYPQIQHLGGEDWRVVDAEGSIIRSRTLGDWLYIQ